MYSMLVNFYGSMIVQRTVTHSLKIRWMASVCCSWPTMKLSKCLICALGQRWKLKIWFNSWKWKWSRRSAYPQAKRKNIHSEANSWAMNRRKNKKKTPRTKTNNLCLMYIWNSIYFSVIAIICVSLFSLFCRIYFGVSCNMVWIEIEIRTDEKCFQVSFVLEKWLKMNIYGKWNRNENRMKSFKNRLMEWWENKRKKKRSGKNCIATLWWCKIENEKR